MDITDIRDRQVMITFHNRASVPCVISDIFFVDGDTFSISVQGARQQGTASAPACTIEAGNGSIASAPDQYHDSSTYRVGSFSRNDPDVMPDGIRPNESLCIVFDLQAGVTLAEIISKLSMGILNISLKLLGATPDAAGILVNDSRLSLSPG